jgi:hydroxymethylbilane synthase
MIQNLKIATRQSRLALWQTEYVADTLRRAISGLEVEILPMTTEGDVRLEQSLAKIGGKGLFIKELETAILKGRADIAVHSMKDVPWRLPDGMTIACVLQRADPGDAIVSAGDVGITELRERARVGTSSLRRQAQIRHLRPDLRVSPVRGNVETRLRKLDEGEFDAVILAAAGLKRLGLGERISARLEFDQCLPAIGQGAIGIECRADNEELIQALKNVEHTGTRRCLDAERALATELQASCESPIAAHGEIRDGELVLQGLVASPDGATVVRGQRRGRLADAEWLGRDLAQELLQQGGREILEGLAREGA